MEYFDVVDQNGNPTGEIIERKEAHRRGIPHRTSRVWIARRRDGQVELLLQKRCKEKDSYPGCYDISSAGHIPAGVDYVPSALRELKEELGVTIAAEALTDCGLKYREKDAVFHGENFVDHQVSRVFLTWLDQDAEAFVVQKEEIDSVMWMEYRACKKAVMEQTIPTCIDVRELEMLEPFLYSER